MQTYSRLNRHDERGETIFEYLNLKIYNLKRISIGTLLLDGLESGKFRYLNDNERNNVFMEM